MSDSLITIVVVLEFITAIAGIFVGAWLGYGMGYRAGTEITDECLDQLSKARQGWHDAIQQYQRPRNRGTSIVRSSGSGRTVVEYEDSGE